MINDKPNSLFYTKQVEQQLEGLHEQFNQKLSGLAQALDLEEADAYLLELSTFYYRSFHESIFPLYRQIVQEDVNRLLSLSLQEETLKQGISGTVKRYAQLYNQVKKLLKTLSQCKDTAYQRILADNRYEDGSVIEIYSHLGLWRDHLKNMKANCQRLDEVMSDMEVNLWQGRVSEPWTIINLVEGLDLEQPLLAAEFTHILAYLRYAHGVVRQIQKEEKPRTDEMEPLIELNRKTSELSRRLIPRSMQRFQSYIVDRATQYIQPLTAYLRLLDRDSFRSTLRRLEQFLEEHLSFLEKCQHFLIIGYREALLLSFNSRGGKEIGLLIEQLEVTVRSLDNLEQEYPIAGDPDFDNFSRYCRKILEEAANWISPLRQDNSGFDRTGSLFTQLQQIDMELQFLLRRMALLHEERFGRLEQRQSLLTVINNLDSFINLLYNIRADLERLLAPRNLARLWKDLSVRVERIPLETGKIFPEPLRHLLEKHKTPERRGEFEDFTILLEEGDLFLIRVGEEQDEEMPGLIIGRKG